MPATVITENEVSLGGTFYPLVGSVRSQLASIYPAKVVIGDANKDSQQRASVVTWGDWRGGMLLSKMKGAADVDRAWYSTWQLRYNGHLVHAPLATQTTDPDLSDRVGPMGELLNELYAPFSTDVRKYNNITDSWDSSLATLPNVATDTITANLGGTDYLVFAHKTGYTYTSNGSSWTNDTEDIQFLSFWDDRLWGIDNTGQLRWSNVIGTWIDDAKLRLPNDSVTDLFVSRDSSGEQILFIMTSVGLFAHDAANEKFIHSYPLPMHPDTGKGTTDWRDAVYIPAGNAIYKRVTGNNTAVVTLEGPDLDDGLPATKRGTIRQLVGTNNDLLAILDSTSPVSTTDMFASRGLGGHHGLVLEPDVGFSLILAYNEVGWETRWESPSTAKAIDGALVSNAYGKYRLWWSQGGVVYWMTLQRDIVNPNEVSDFTYASAATLETPWFDAGQAEVNKLALRLRVEVNDTSSTETVTVSYATDYSTTFTAFESIRSDGTTAFDFPDSDTPTGTTFRAIRIKVVGARGSTTTNSPDVLSITLEYRKKLPAKWGYTFNLDLNKPYKGKTVKAMRAALLAMVEQNLLSEFTYRDDGGGTLNFYVDAVSASGTEYTGHDERGLTTVLVMEP
jgi:hypothetical protein